jgi:hypothetical protein
VLRLTIAGLDSCIIKDLRHLSDSRQTWLALATDANQILECQPISGNEICARYALPLGSAFNVFNEKLVTHIDAMVVDTLAPKIQAADRTVQSIALACKGIGYCNMLIWAKVKDESVLIQKDHDISPIFAEMAITRLNDLILKVMGSIRGVQHELDTESRSGIILWYLYLSVIHKELPKLGRCRILVSHAIFHDIYCNLTQA